MGCGGDRVVYVLALYSDFRVQILLKPAVFSVKFVSEKNENKQTKEASVGPLKTTMLFRTQTSDSNQIIYLQENGRLFVVPLPLFPSDIDRGLAIFMELSVGERLVRHGRCVGHL